MQSSVTLTAQYDADSNRTQLSATIGTTADFVNNYQYADNRMTQVKQTGAGGNAVQPKRVDISYNNDGQLHTPRYNDLAGTPSNLAAVSTYTCSFMRFGGSALRLTHPTGLATGLYWL